MSREIRLTKGRVTVVDDDDYEWLSQYKWQTLQRADGSVAAMRKTSSREPSSKRTVFMHRAITKAAPDMVVDHINHDTLDNRKCNLRVCTDSQNTKNCKASKSNTSGYKGVSRYVDGKRWFAQITVNWKHFHLGIFDNKHDAARAYNEAAIIYHGDFCYLNHITEEEQA
jgi:hypothetical protein